MSIAGINGYNYSNYYTGTKRNTAKANGMNSGLLSNVSSTSSNITLHMSGTEDSGNALTAVGFPDGSSASVYKSDAKCNRLLHQELTRNAIERGD